MPRAATQRTDRRGRIARSLYECIAEKGYANTSLKDIAQRADMSPSHVGYYFDNKGAILEYYAKAICRQNLADFPKFDDSDVGKSIDELVDFCLGPRQMTTALLGVIQELTGLAVHDARLHETKSNHTRAWRKHLESFFEATSSRSDLSVREAAWRAHAVLVGLNTNMLFDGELDRDRAHELFRSVLHDLTGFHSRSRRRVPTDRHRKGSVARPRGRTRRRRT